MKIIFCSESEKSYQFNFLEVFPDLTQPHRCVRKYFCLFDLLVQDLSEHHLEGHRDPCLLQILLEHLSLLLSFGGLVHPLSSLICTSFISSYYSGSGSGSFGGGGGTGSGSGFLGSSFFGDSFLGSSFFGSSFLGSGDLLGSGFLAALGGISVLYLLSD